MVVYILHMRVSSEVTCVYVSGMVQSTSTEMSIEIGIPKSPMTRLAFDDNR